MSEGNKPSAEAVASYIADALRADPEAEKSFRANPAKFLEEQSGQSVPEGVRIEVHENSDTVWHIPLGARPGPIDEVNLDSVAGGCGDMAAMEAEANRKYADLPPPTGTPPPSGSNRRPKPNKKK